MEDLQLSPKVAQGRRERLCDADGQIPCQIDGGLKSAINRRSGIRMLYEMYLQLETERGSASFKPSIGMTHNLGGSPRLNVAAGRIIER